MALQKRVNRGSDSEFKYTQDLVNELDDIITKYDQIRNQFETDMRLFFLVNGGVTYKILKRGDILYNQGSDSADSFFLILTGSCTLIKNFINYELLYKIENQKRVQRALMGEEPSE